MRIRTVLLTLAGALAACAAPPPDNADRAAREFDVAEAVFRHQFADNASAAQQKAAAYFLTIRGADPAPEFLARFTGHTPPVRAGSAFVMGSGLSFRIDTIEWQGDRTVKATGGYYEGTLSASGNVYTIEFEGDRWVVTADTMEWIS